MSVSAYIVDDEPLAIERLKRLIEESSKNVVIAGSSSSPRSALTYLQSHHVDVLFLDVSMPGMTGFELLDKLASPPQVVFTTAYDEYAVKAFEVNSVDYLMKPIALDQLERALTRIERLRDSGMQTVNMRQLIEGLAATLKQPPTNQLERMASRVGDRVLFVDLAKVTHFYADDKLTYAVSEGKALSVDYSINSLEKRLDPKRFVRIHRGTLVNCDFIKEVVSVPGGSLIVRLKDASHTELPVARNRNQELKSRLGL